ncbi:MAN1A1 [Blepharisma stoltei]|uniref:alpha-1,2-Mannosidase n=1 Tax=Blepharisma stoltei TaxID=1481888 RepID=A0AAU9JJR3_9CILI|nr:unnamed protein product [Blepharisma stoltei]
MKRLHLLLGNNSLKVMIAALILWMIISILALSYLKPPRADIKTDISMPSLETCREEIKGAFKHAWFSYKRYSWGFDELMPVSRNGKNWLYMGSTIIDSLDTLWIFGMDEEFKEAKEWVKNSLDFSACDCEVSVFEVNIRILGGLLSAYELSKDSIFLQKATELGDLMVHSFTLPHNFPYPKFNFKRKTGSSLDRSFLSIFEPNWKDTYLSLAGFGSLQLELSALSHHTKNSIYANLANSIIKHVFNIWKEDLFPNKITLNGDYVDKFSVAAGVDSFYEYLLKEYLHTNKTNESLKERFVRSLNAVIDNLVGQDSSGLYFLGYKSNNALIPEFHQFACYYPGLMILAANSLPYLDKRDEIIFLSQELASTCYQMNHKSATGLATESAMINNGIQFPILKNTDHGLRPETIESFWYFYYYTHDAKYQKWGWEIFKAIQKYAKLSVGYSELQNANTVPPGRTDRMQSYFLAETLKYLYLLLSEDQPFDLDEWVFNTEGHPLKVN